MREKVKKMDRKSKGRNALEWQRILHRERFVYFTRSQSLRGPGIIRKRGCGSGIPTDLMKRYIV